MAATNYLGESGLSRFKTKLETLFVKKTDIDSSISSGSTSTNPPSSQAVANFVASQGGGAEDVGLSVVDGVINVTYTES